MEISVYVFGNLGKGLTQYPDDYAKEIFEDFFTRANADTQMIVHRDKDLMYYGYIRKLDNKSQFIGFCALLNGLMFNNIENLFPIFENAVGNLVARGEILKLSSKGNIVPCVEALNAKQIEVERISNVIKDEISKLENETIKLPAIDYSIASNEYKTFSIEDDYEDIVEATAKYGYTYIYKKSNYESPTLSAYKKTIKGLNTQIDNLKKELKELKEKNNKLAAKNVTMRSLIYCCVFVIIAIVGYMIYSHNEHNYKDRLDKAENTIETRDKTINNQEKNIEELRSSLSEERSKREEAEKELSEFKEKVGNYMPLIITDIEIANTSYDGDIETDYGNTIYSSNSMFLKPRITYYGISSGNVNFKIK